MSVFKKIKDVLFDIEEEEEVVSTVNKSNPVIDRNPIKEVKMPVETKELDFDEPVESVKTSSSNFKFPMDFDDELPSRSDNVRSEVKTRTSSVNFFDDDFDTPRRKREEYIVREPERKSDAPRDYSKYLQAKKDEKKKMFTPSPVISPVYGVLNQNYTKDDVIVKTDTGVKSPSLEEVRKKAYEKKKKMEEKQVDDEFDEPLKTLDEILINNQISDNVQSEDAINEDDLLNNSYESNNIDLDVHNNHEIIDNDLDDELNEDDTLEKDLFNLIDSMYDDKDGEDEE